MPKTLQTSFGGGEISPEVGARSDLDKYSSSLLACENFFVRAQGGVSYRTGFQYIAEVKDSTKTTLAQEFEFNTSQTYAIEVGDQYFRFHTNGGLVLDSSDVETITGATAADPVVLTTSASHGWSNGQEIYITGVVGMTELNGRHFKVANVTATTAELQDLGGTDIDGSAYTAYTSGGQAFMPYEVTTPYLEADLADLEFVQSADVMTITHPTYEQRELIRNDNDDWTLSTISFEPEQDHPTALSVTANSTGSEVERYVVTAVNRETGEESLPALNSAAAGTITGVTQADPAVVTCSGAHNLDAGDEIEISGVVGMTEINGNRYKVGSPGATTFELLDSASANVDSTSYTAYTSGGSVYAAYDEITNGHATRNNTVTWTAPAGASKFAVYRRDNGIYGYIGSTELETFTDDNIESDLGDTPPQTRDPFNGTGDYPSVAGYFQQRRIFANTNNATQKLWFTQTGNFYNLAVSSPTKADDAITVTIAALRANEIRHVIPIKKDLVVLTSGGEWLINGQDGTFSPSTIQIAPQTYYGSTSLRPIVAGEVVIYMQPGEVVRDLGYKFESDAYSGNDLSILARHLFDGYTIDDWAFAVAPYSIIWGVRSDGTICALTYMREQKIYAWHRHTTYGKFKSVAVIRELNEDRPYAVVERIIGSRTVQFMERMASAVGQTDVQDMIHLDCSSTLDEPVVITGFTNADPVVITTATPHGFSNGDMVDITGLVVKSSTTTTGRADDTDINGTGYTVANVTATTFELQNNGADVDGTAFGVYCEGGEVRAAVTTVSGLWHLEGETVTAVANGNVVRSLTVTNGAVTLPDASSRVHVGFEYTGDMETVDLSTANEVIVMRDKKLSRLNLLLSQSRGLWVGSTRDNMREVKFKIPAQWGQPPALFTGIKGTSLPPDWNKHGRVVLQQRDPLPLSILALSPDAHVGGN